MTNEYANNKTNKQKQTNSQRGRGEERQMREWIKVIGSEGGDEGEGIRGRG